MSWRRILAAPVKSPAQALHRVRFPVVYRPALGALPPGHSRGPKLHRAGFTERKAFLQCFGFGWTELQGHCYPVSAPIPQHISQYLAQHQ